MRPPAEWELPAPPLALCEVPTLKVGGEDFTAAAGDGCTPKTEKVLEPSDQLPAATAPPPQQRGGDCQLSPHPPPSIALAGRANITMKPRQPARRAGGAEARMHALTTP